MKPTMKNWRVMDTDKQVMPPFSICLLLCVAKLMKLLRGTLQELLAWSLNVDKGVRREHSLTT